MKTILVPIDFSEQSHMALSTAVALSKREPAQVHIVHMLELDVRKSERVTDQLRERTDFLVSSAQKGHDRFFGRPRVPWKQLHSTLQSVQGL
ncbi:MAG: universal stress protein [Bacteroidota bacterium]